MMAWPRHATARTPTPTSRTSTRRAAGSTSSSPAQTGDDEAAVDRYQQTRRRPVGRLPSRPAARSVTTTASVGARRHWLPAEHGATGIEPVAHGQTRGRSPRDHESRRARAGRLRRDDNAGVSPRSRRSCRSRSVTTRRPPPARGSSSPGRTADYPSRKAQAALAVARRHRADHPRPRRPALSLRRLRSLPRRVDPVPDRPIWRARSGRSAPGSSRRARCPRLPALADMYRTYGISTATSAPRSRGSGPGDDGADVLFVPGRRRSSMTPDAAAAALRVARLVAGRVALDGELLDSGTGAAGTRSGGRGRLDSRHAPRRRVAEAGYRLVLAGTPKEAFGLREALVGLPVEVGYVGTAFASAVARTVGRRSRQPTGARSSSTRPRPSFIALTSSR